MRLRVRSLRSKPLRAPVNISDPRFALYISLVNRERFSVRTLVVDYFELLASLYPLFASFPSLIARYKLLNDLLKSCEYAITRSLRAECIPRETFLIQRRA